MKNIIDITISAEQEATVNLATEALVTAMPFLRSFSAAQRKALIQVGPRRRSFARLALEVARLQTNYMPPSVNLGSMERDLALYDLLTPVRTQLMALLQKVKDTQHAASHDACEAGLEVYRALRGHAREAGLDALVAELGLTLRTPPLPLPVPVTEPPAEGGTNP